MNSKDSLSSVQNTIWADAQSAINNKTKPLGSLGQLEAIAVQLSAIQNTLSPTVDPARVIVFGADHGVTYEGVSAFPAEVTLQMMANFAAGGAAVCVLTASANASLEVVDVGVDGDLSQFSSIIQQKVAMGTRNLAHTAAMSHEELDSALQVGREAVVRAAKDGQRCIGLGEMGIGNTTSAAILTGLMCTPDAAAVTGRGTGLSDEKMPVKQRVVADAIARLLGMQDDPLECLREAGGLEIAALVGAMLEAPAHKLPVIVDGFIVTAAALIACRIRPGVRDGLFFAHQSAETGHRVALEKLNAKPLLQLEMRLGEGSAAALAIPLLRGAAAVMSDMASFADAGVSTGQ
ncbi:MAG: nicotinate-nucleotide--dimethylbenzimidazole phosphoribosyltransferase [Gammaproteobacteria bacterium]|jgi:nicotinate-nucleotide--dimethylbenzimidazole phosphoribosyltransferase